MNLLPAHTVMRVVMNVKEPLSFSMGGITVKNGSAVKIGLWHFQKAESVTVSNINPIIDDIKAQLVLYLVTINVPEYMTWVSVDRNGSVWMWENEPVLNRGRMEWIYLPTAIFTDYVYTKMSINFTHHDMSEIYEQCLFDINELIHGYV